MDKNDEGKKPDGTAGADRTQALQLAEELKRRLTRVFPKVYMRGVDFSSLPIETLRDMRFLVKDIEDLDSRANSVNKSFGWPAGPGR